MLGWLKRQLATPNPEALWTVVVDGDRIHSTDPEGQMLGATRGQLSKVQIETNDSGPWGTDLWWVLLNAEGTLACAFPGGATGEQDALRWLQALPDFDDAAASLAMASTRNATFTLWTRAA